MSEEKQVKLSAPAGAPTKSAEQKKLDRAKKLQQKHLDERLQTLYRRAHIIEKQLGSLHTTKFYRVCIFGSARIKPDTAGYDQVFQVARQLAWGGVDILTGGGPGLMEAANKGALLGREEKKTKTRSVGITIELDFEPEPNKHIDVKRHHEKFSSRLDDFMRLSDAVICTPGGIGTLLELYFSWQLIQVRHISARPIILLDRSFWGGLVEWMKAQPLGRGLVSAKDIDDLHVVDTPEEVAAIISAHHKIWQDTIAQTPS
jgi:uncharacterized protein (TIGR00730 family)